MNLGTLTGPQFLWLYGVLLVVSTVVAGVLRWRALGSARASLTLADLDVYEKAVLSAGTTQRAVDVALTRLTSRGLQISGKGMVAAGPAVSSEHPAEQAVLASIDEVPTDVAIVRRRAGRHAALDGLRDRLVNAGLLTVPARVRRAALAFLPLLLLGVARLGWGILLRHPVGYLVVLLMVTAAIALWFWGRVPTHTRRGRDVLRAEQTRNAALRTAAEHGRVGGFAEGAMALALFGIGSALVPEGAASGTRPYNTRHTAVSCGGCGSAGCGGGGCGGCGGCGG